MARPHEGGEVVENDESSSCASTSGMDAEESLRTIFTSGACICIRVPAATGESSSLYQKTNSFLTLKPLEHQVAGHRFREGKQGSLVDLDGRFYKPLQAGPRGQRELAFYQVCRTARSSEQGKEGSVQGKEGRAMTSLAKIQHYFPVFHGTVTLGGGGNGEGLRHLVLDDVTLPYKYPSIIDLKVGHKTWYSGADGNYIDKCLRKDSATTSKSLGFKVCGLQLWRGEEGEFWRPSKAWSKKLGIHDVREVIASFLAIDDTGEAVSKRRMLMQEDFLRQLREIRAWFEIQTEYHFYSASLLVLCEGLDLDENGEEVHPNVRIYLVDFAHTFPTETQELDNNFIRGLVSLEQAVLGLMGIAAN